MLSNLFMDILAMLAVEADDDTTEEWFQSNICRCTSYEEIREAVKSVLYSNAKKSLS